MSQEVRNKVYLLGASIAGVLVIMGVVDKANADVALGLFNSALDSIAIVALLVTNVIAFIKSLRSKVTVVEVPKDQVRSVNLLNGGEALVSGTKVQP